MNDRQKLALELLKKLDTSVKYEVIRWAAFYVRFTFISSSTSFPIRQYSC